MPWLACAVPFVAPHHPATHSQTTAHAPPFDPPALHAGLCLISQPPCCDTSPHLAWPGMPHAHEDPGKQPPLPSRIHRHPHSWHTACLINPALWSDRCCFPHFGPGFVKPGVEREILCTDLVQKLPELVQSANSGLLFRILRHAHSGAPGLIEGEPERLSRHLNKPGVGRSDAANLLLFQTPHTTVAMHHFRADRQPGSACSSA